MTNTEFAKIRVAAHVSSVELADYAGASRLYMLRVEGGDEPVQSWMLQSLNNLIQQREAA